MLHVTNGDSANETLRRAGIAGEMLAWSDCLHEGPVPASLDLEALSSIRAQFIAKSHGLEPECVLSRFRERDGRLMAFRDHDEIVLWSSFELYDQLHLLQLSDWFSERDLGDTRLSVIFVADYLGMIAPTKAVRAYSERIAATPALLRLGQRGWASFCSSDPRGLASLAKEDLAEAPFLAKALIRLLEELPARHDGLSRTERHILESISEGVTELRSLFGAVQKKENPAFMGDSSFWTIIADMLRGRNPPLAMADSQAFPIPGEHQPFSAEARERVKLTSWGARLLAGDGDLVTDNGLDRWLGGIHLTDRARAGSTAVWRWDSQSETCVFE